MKFKATKKQIKQNYSYIVGVSYCKLQTLLENQNPIAYSEGVYGWACDYYLIENSKGQRVLVSTGYNYIPNQNLNPDYDKINDFEKQAQIILYGRHEIAIPYETKKTLIKNLMSEFVDYVLSTKQD
jgi:hypothetical protein